MELRLLEYFLAVAREQSITAAAESLHISQPALSIQLKVLEDELGKQLLIRSVKGTRKVILTEEGVVLRNRAEEILSLVQRTADEISSSNEIIAGEVFIGAGETRLVRLFAEAAHHLQKEFPDIHYSLKSGNAEYVMEYLDKGLIDFGLVFTEADSRKYESIPIPIPEVWGVLMRRDSPLAEKECITPEDLWDKPLIISHQKGDDTYLVGRWLRKKDTELNVIATYNLLYNASLLVEEGLGYALCFENLINTAGSDLCLRPLSPRLEARGFIIWKKYQVFSKAASVFLSRVRELLGTTAQKEC